MAPTPSPPSSVYLLEDDVEESAYYKIPLTADSDFGDTSTDNTDDEANSVYCFETEEQTTPQ